MLPPSSHHVAVSFEGEVDRGVEEGVAGADECSQRLSLRCDERFFEGDPLVARKHGLTGADQPVAAADGRRHVAHLEAARLALADGSAEPGEGFFEEGLDVVRLESAGVRALHLLADLLDAARIHGVLRQGPLLEKLLELLSVEGSLDGLLEACPDLRLLPVADRW